MAKVTMELTPADVAAAVTADGGHAFEIVEGPHSPRLVATLSEDAVREAVVLWVADTTFPNVTADAVRLLWVDGRLGAVVVWPPVAPDGTIGDHP